MKFNETKQYLNDLLWEFNGTGNSLHGLESITEAMGGCFHVHYRNEENRGYMNINPKAYSCKGELAKQILNAIY